MIGIITTIVSERIYAYLYFCHHQETSNKTKKAININGIVANIAQKNSLHTGTTPITFLADQYHQGKNQNHGMGIKNKDEFKHHILTTYRVSPKHTEPVPCYNLEPIVDYGYALYKRRGRYMHLIDIIPLIKADKKHCQL